jgi:hypothetical protein
MVDFMNSRNSGSDALDNLVYALMQTSQLGQGYNERQKQKQFSDVLLGNNIPQFANQEFTPQQLDEQRINQLMAINPAAAPQIAEMMKALKVGNLAGAQADIINQYLYGQQGQAQPQGGQPVPLGTAMTPQGAPMMPQGAVPQPQMNPDQMALEAIVQELNRANMLKGASGGLIDNTPAANLKADLFKSRAGKIAEGEGELIVTNKTNAVGAQGFKEKVGKVRSLINEIGSETGPIEGNTAYQFGARVGGTKTQDKRDRLKSLLADLELDVAKMKLKGQGAVTEAEREIARSTLPKLTNNLDANLSILQDLESQANSILKTGGMDNQSAPQQPALDLKSMSLEELQALRAKVGGR